jgi:hypothetical protein
MEDMMATDKPKVVPQEKRVGVPVDDPLDAGAVLEALEAQGWGSVKEVNALAFGPNDVPSLPYVEEALTILTALRDKLRVKGTA